MSGRREALERAMERQEEQLERDYRAGRLSPEQYAEEQRELAREAQYEARAAMDEDLADLMDDWR